MALISVDYFSSSLMRTTTLEVILPIDDQGAAYATDSAMRHAGGTLEAEMRTWEQHPYPPKKAPFKTLFLLHGISGNHADWISETRIRNWAENHGIAVVMPSGYNAFYLDQPEVHNYYGRFVGQELVEVARRMFPSPAAARTRSSAVSPWARTAPCATASSTARRLGPSCRSPRR